MSDYVSRQYLLDEYDRQHQGPPGGARKIIEEAPAADVVPTEPQEIDKLRLYIKKDGRADVCTLLIKSDRFSQSYGNHADDDVELYNYDYIFNNNCSIEELEDSFMDFFKGGILNE